MIDRSTNSPIPKRVPVLFGVISLILAFMGGISAFAGWSELLTFMLTYGFFIMGVIGTTMYLVRKHVKNSIAIIEGKESR